MSDTPVQPHLVLSIVPLDAAYRDELQRMLGGAAEFRDVATERRAGVWKLFSGLRRRRYASAVVAAAADEFFFAGDMLSVLCLTVRAPRHVVIVRGSDARPVRRSEIPRFVFRIAAGTTAALFAMILNFLQKKRVPLRTFEDRAERLLYLKPTLMLGSPIGGSVGHVAGVANALARRGLAVRLVALNEQPMVSSAVEQVAVPPRFIAGFPHELNSHRYHRVFNRAALAEARRMKAQLIYQRYSLNDLSGVRIARRLRIPLVMEFNGSETWIQKNWGRRLRFETIAESIEGSCVRGADLVVAVSEEVARQVRDYGVPEERILFYPNGVDVEIFDPALYSDADRSEARARLGVPAGSFLMTFVGTFGRWHGTEVLAQSIRILTDSHREWLERNRVHFLLIGDGPHAPAVREILGPQLTGPFVTMAGLRPQRETPATLAASDILLSPHAPNADGSPFFGSPTKLFEYMAMRRLIIASDLDQIGQILRGWRPGLPILPSSSPAAALLVKPGDAEDLARAIRVAVEMPAAERDAFARRALDLVKSGFTWDANVDAVLERLSRRRAA